MEGGGSLEDEEAPLAVRLHGGPGAPLTLSPPFHGPQRHEAGPLPGQPLQRGASAAFTQQAFCACPLHARARQGGDSGSPPSWGTGSSGEKGTTGDPQGWETGGRAKAAWSRARQGAGRVLTGEDGTHGQNQVGLGGLAGPRLTPGPGDHVGL